MSFRIKSTAHFKLTAVGRDCLNSSAIVLNIAVNMERLSQWSQDGNLKRLDQFLAQTEGYLVRLQRQDVSEKFKPTLIRFTSEMELLKNSDKQSMKWAEKALTWANILTHRAKLA